MSESPEVRIAFIGCVAEGRRSLETLLDIGETVAGIFTLEPARAAKVSGAVRWDDLAEDHGIPLHLVKNINDPEPVEILRGLKPDLVFCVGWTQLLRQEILGIPTIGCIGFHASMLPRYRGRAPVNWAIIHGERETGNTMMLLDDGVDTGDIIAQRRISIEDDDTCGTVYDKVADSEDAMLREVMPLVHLGRMPRTPQDDELATVMPRRRPRDGIIDWSRTTRDLYNWIRAQTHPYPGAFTRLDGEKVRVWTARPGPAAREGEEASRIPAGWWRLEGDTPRLVAGTGDGVLVLERVQRKGDDEMDGVDFARKWLPPEGLQAGEDGS